MRQNTSRIELEELLDQLSLADIDVAVGEYLATHDLKAWFKNVQSGPSRRYFLIWKGEKLDAKAIAKSALRENGHEYEDWHTDPIIDALEEIGCTIWDVERDGQFDQDAATTYEITKRLARNGQQRFRGDALRLWGDRCAVSGVTIDRALEAAHIVPHTESGQMDAQNSIVLRADLHRLFDSNMMAINPSDMSVNFAERARKSYAEFEGKAISSPDGGPKVSAFEARWQIFCSL